MVFGTPIISIFMQAIISAIDLNRSTSLVHGRALDCSPFIFPNIQLRHLLNRANSYVIEKVSMMNFIFFYEARLYAQVFHMFVNPFLFQDILSILPYTPHFERIHCIVVCCRGKCPGFTGFSTAYVAVEKTKQFRADRA